MLLASAEGDASGSDGRVEVRVMEGRRMRPEHWLFTIPLRLRSLFRWSQADQELDDELRDHLERKTEGYVAQGMGQEEAPWAPRLWRYRANQREVPGRTTYKLDSGFALWFPHAAQIP